MASKNMMNHYRERRPRRVRNSLYLLELFLDSNGSEGAQPGPWLRSEDNEWAPFERIGARSGRFRPSAGLRRSGVGVVGPEPDRIAVRPVRLAQHDLADDPTMLDHRRVKK
jgi:hypothetical protein